MNQKTLRNEPKHEDLIKFVAPPHLKQELLQLARERTISLSSLMRLISTEYIKKQR